MMSVWGTILPKKIMEDLKEFEYKGIVINRIAPKYKDMFKKIAEEDYCDDYGMCLTIMIQDYLEYRKLKEMLLNNILTLKLNSNGGKNE